MGFFGIGTEKKTDVEDEEENEREEEKQEQDAAKDMVFVEEVNGLTNRQLLELIAVMQFENIYEDIYDDWEDLIKHIKEDK